MELIEQTKAKKAFLIGLRREFHRHPELAFQETKTAQTIERELDRLGIPHTRVGATGVLGILAGGQNGGSVALRADIDALPIPEAHETEYRSACQGVMHACGHDAHTACLLGAAALLSERRAELHGEVRLIFQPAEEVGGGAVDFLKAGALNNVRRVFGLHCAPDLPLGTVGLTPGLNNAAVDQFRIRVKGKAAHVSAPQLGADALYAACQTVTALQGLVTRRTSPTEPVLIGIGKLQAGTTYNAVADSAELEGTTRTISQEAREQIREWITETAQQTARLSGAEAETLWTEITSALVNDPQACREAEGLAKKLGIHVISDRPLSLCGDNFAEYLLKTPGCYAYLGTANPEYPATCIGLHNGGFDLDEDALPLGAALYAACALGWLA